jgi:hypothetical protein
MTYTPINTQAYTAAFSGAVAGMAVNGWISSPDGSNYTLVCGIAGAFAQAFDVVWNNATVLNGLEYSAIQQVCGQEFAQRGPGPVTAAKFADPANWEVPARACATLALQADLYFAGQGITPPSLGGSSAFVKSVSTSGASLVNPSGATVHTDPFSVPYSIGLTDLLAIRMETYIVTADNPAPASSYFNYGMALEMSTDNQATWNAIAGGFYVATLLAPPLPNSDAPEHAYTELSVTVGNVGIYFGLEGPSIATLARLARTIRFKWITHSHKQRR